MSGAPTSSECSLCIFCHGIAFVQDHKLELVAAEVQNTASKQVCTITRVRCLFTGNCRSVILP